MGMEDAMLVDLIDLILNSNLFRNLSNLFKDFLEFFTSIVRLLLMQIKCTIQNEIDIEDQEEEAEEEECDTTPQQECNCCSKKGEVTCDDLGVVTRRLGMAGRWSDEECNAMQGIDVLLEEKEASLEELEEAFYVFDRNEDGFISPAELWCVMRRLWLQEGAKLEDCEKMIRVFDEDGDGMINFTEFRHLLEIAA